MTAKELARLALAMREAQRRYFSARAHVRSTFTTGRVDLPGLLAESRRLEMEFDRAVRFVLAGAEQTTLFPIDEGKR